MFGDLLLAQYQNQTTAHPIGVFVLFVLGVATLLVSRRWALVPLLILACCVASAQRFVIASLDFNFLRVLVFVLAARIIIRNEATHWRWKPMDLVFLVWIACATILYIVLHGTWQSFIYRLGILYDAIGLYFVTRLLIRDWADVRAFVQTAAVLSVPVAMVFLVEHATRRNFFSIFGGVPEITLMRDGRLRCQGPFSHPILAGCFWISLTPLMAALWWRPGWNRLLAIIGVVAPMVIVYTCASSTPVGGVFAGAVALAVLPLRRRMAWVRWGAVAMVLGLHLVMKAPVWHLISRVSFARGSTGWYRYKLIDDFITHFGDWWLIGTESRETWFGHGYWQITNQYVAEGVNGGLITLLLFLAVIALAFQGVGRIWRHAARRRYRIAPWAGAARRLGGPRAVQPGSRAHFAMGWALGTALFMHCVMFTGVAYFGQTILVWYVLLGMIGSLTPVLGPRRAPFGRRFRLQRRPALGVRPLRPAMPMP
ncbi:MAG: hypothetical protein SYC29_01860 [Planctomycetota bacterium]|nr:hypothetical protein [Planctomycetota bacterium]